MHVHKLQKYIYSIRPSDQLNWKTVDDLCRLMMDGQKTTVAFGEVIILGATAVATNEKMHYVPVDPFSLPRSKYPRRQTDNSIT